MKTNNNFHILIVDDELMNIELAEIYLEEDGYRVSSATNAKDALEIVLNTKIDLILLDINMPVTDGFELCKILKKERKTKDIAVIFLTAQTDIEYISKAFEVGGVDYLTKPFFGVELKARVKTQLEKVAYLEEIKKKQSKLAQLSVTDPLTKLHNSLFFDAQILSYQKRDERFWFIYLKIERFEKINELYGYYGANKILKQFAQILEAVAFKNSIVGRLVGASFGVLLKDYEEEQIRKVVDALFLALLKEKRLDKVISLKAITYHIIDSSVSVPLIYKKLQSSMHDIEKNPEVNQLFIK